VKTPTFTFFPNILRKLPKRIEKKTLFYKVLQVAMNFVAIKKSTKQNNKWIVQKCCPKLLEEKQLLSACL